MLKVNFKNSYFSKKGNKVFVYRVSGTDEELEQYSSHQTKAVIDEEDGSPLWFTTRPIGMQGRLLITQNGNVVADTAELDMAIAVAEQNGGKGVYGQEIAKEIARRSFGNLFAAPTPTVRIQKAPVVDPIEVTPEDLDS